jgi:hypothetical protein
VLCSIATRLTGNGVSLRDKKMRPGSLQWAEYSSFFQGARISPCAYSRGSKASALLVINET